MKVQDYLRSGKTLADLETEYAIKSRVCDELGVVSLNYNQILSLMSERICQECRGLILELETWNVVNKSFDKFFNHGKQEAATLDWSTARVEEKLDGSLICIYYHRGEWRIASRGVADASGDVGTNGMTFRDLVMTTLRGMGIDWVDLQDLLKRNMCYSFELTGPENRVIVPYWERRLTLLAAWHRETLIESDAANCDIVVWGRIPCVRRYALNVSSCEQLAELAAVINPADGEGYVVVDANYNRVKVKSPLYVAASTLVSGLTTTKQHLELLMSDKYDDIAALLPDFVRTEIDKVAANVQRMAETIMETYAAIRFIESQKDFAAESTKYPYSPILFGLRKGTSIDAGLRRMTSDGLVRLYDAMNAD